MLAVLLPSSARLDALAGVDLGRRTQDRDEIAMAAYFDTEDAETGLRTMERNAFHEPRQRLPTALLVR